MTDKEINKADELRRRIQQAENNYQQSQRRRRKRHPMTPKGLAIGLIIAGALLALSAYFFPMVIPAELIEGDLFMWRLAIPFGILVSLLGLYTLFRHR